jgi:hypothetical protein
VTLSHKVEQIYDYAVSQLISGATAVDLSLFTSEYYWTTFNQKQKPFVQAISNFLYSLSRLTPNKMNQDLIFFERLLLSGASGKRNLLVFLLFRQIFQRVLDKSIVKGNTLRLDPNCTDIDRELITSIAHHLGKIDPDHPTALADYLAEKCKLPKTEYYAIARLLIDDTEVLDSHKEQLCRDALIFFSEQFSKNEQSNLESEDFHAETLVTKLESNQERQNESINPQHQFEEYSITGKPQSEFKSHHADYENYRVERENYDNHAHKKQQSGIPLSNGEHHSSKERIGDGVPDQIVELIQIYLNLQENSGLERRIRASLANLVCKFVEILVREQQPPDIKSAIAKIDQVVIRKTQNLLTSLFRENKNEFREILRLKPDESEDNARIDVLFDTYLLLKRFSHPPDSEIESLTKRVLKVKSLLP